MNLNTPSVQLPEPISRMCQLDLSQKKKFHLQVCNIIEGDKFLSLYVTETFQEYIGKGGIMTLINSVGWEGLKNRLSEAYLNQFFYGDFPREIELDLVLDAVDFEKRFQFLSPLSSTRVFQLGLWLKLVNLELEKNNLEQKFVLIPPEVDEILISSRAKSVLPDWLIIATWGLVDLVGAAAAKDILISSKGKLNRIERELSEDNKKKWYEMFVRYGYAIQDDSIFLSIKV